MYKRVVTTLVTLRFQNKSQCLKLVFSEVSLSDECLFRTRELYPRFKNEHENNQTRTTFFFKSSFSAMAAIFSPDGLGCTAKYASRERFSGAAMEVPDVELDLHEFHIRLDTRPYIEYVQYARTPVSSSKEYRQISICRRVEDTKRKALKFLSFVPRVLLLARYYGILQMRKAYQQNVRLNFPDDDDSSYGSCHGKS
ncbi:hypothetical protein GQX74_010172 [Glossina fuscipes]|nr:hypothetical protein GQX74_010172 [Glossina fuscipes]